jgi:30S ribosomal protein S31
MGRGDIKTKKGKRTAGSYGVSRKRKEVKPVIEAKTKKAEESEPKATEDKAEPKKAAAKKPAVAKKPTAKKAADKKEG